MNMKFEIIENNGLELIGIVKKIEMRKGAEEATTSTTSTPKSPTGSTERTAFR